MSVAALRLQPLLLLSGLTYLAAVLVIVFAMAPLGSGLFLGGAFVMIACFAAVLWRVWNETVQSRRLLFLAFGFAVLFRIPLAVAPVGPDSDMVRYLWDGRVQLLGYNPYAVLPADPALAHTHTEQTAAMPSRRHRTPYPPAAQLFFRLVVGIWDSTYAMKAALVVCDLLTLLILRRSLAMSGRSEWLALAYAWNPLVVLEVAHSGHIDVVVALWTAAAAYWLAQRRTALASIAFVLAIATKVLPIVLAPLFIGRVRWRDALLGAAVLVFLYLPFASASQLPFGSVPNVVYLRFNGPVFQAIASVALSPGAAAFAVLAGAATALWVRRRLAPDDPAAWAWPMAVALLAAPVVYPWYLLAFTPFLISRRTLPLLVWTASVLPVYIVWRIVSEGGRWLVPMPVLLIEYGLLAASSAGVLILARQQRQAGAGSQLPEVSAHAAIEENP